MMAEMDCLGDGVEISTYTPLTISGTITVSGNHKYMVICAYRSSSVPTVTLNSSSVTAKATNSTSPYVYTFIIPYVKNGDTVTLSVGDASGCYMD